MLKKSLRLLPLVAALFTASLPAQAADYHVVVPAPGKAAPYAAIKLELSPAILPVGVVGDPFAGFDFNSALRITGDPDLDMSQVAWSVYAGSLPAGLLLSRDGGLSGTPTEIGEPDFQLIAKYNTKSALGSYSVAVNDITLILDAVLPQAHPKKAYHYSLAAQLAVDGDPNYTPEAVTWSLVDGALPDGLSLTAAGDISGNPAVDGVYPIKVQASYKGRSVSTFLRLDVIWSEINIQTVNGARNWEDGTYAQSCNGYRNPTGVYRYAGDVGDGVYRVQLEGQSYDVQCDMATDGGGWQLALNYLHNGNTDPNLNVRTTSFPLQGSTTLGQNEAGSNSTWGHTAPGLLAKVPYIETRFQCSTSAHNRKLHFKTNSPSIKSYFTTGVGAVALPIPATQLSGHSAFLPGSAAHRYADQGSAAMTEFPFWNSGTHHWGMGKSNTGASIPRLRWECDDYFEGKNTRYHTHHQIWVR